MLIKIIFWGHYFHYIIQYQRDSDLELEKRTALYWSINRTGLGPINPLHITCKQLVKYLNCVMPVLCQREHYVPIWYVRGASLREVFSVNSSCFIPSSRA
jgi:hypothetical protein